VPTVTAVHGTARVSAVRAAPARPGAVRGDMEEVRAIQRDRVNAAARHGRKLVHAVFYGSQGCNPQTSVQNATIHAKRGRTGLVDTSCKLLRG